MTSTVSEDFDLQAPTRLMVPSRRTLNATAGRSVASRRRILFLSFERRPEHRSALGSAERADGVAQENAPPEVYDSMWIESRIARSSRTSSPDAPGPEKGLEHLSLTVDVHDVHARDFTGKERDVTVRTAAEPD